MSDVSLAISKPIEIQACMIKWIYALEDLWTYRYVNGHINSVCNEKSTKDIYILGAITIIKIHSCSEISSYSHICVVRDVHFGHIRNMPSYCL